MKAGQSSSSPMHFEMAQRKGKAVVDADQRRYVFGQSRDKPFGDATPRPVFARARSVASPRLVAMIDLPCECSWYEHRHTSAWCCPGQHRNLGAVLIPSPNSDSTEIWGNLTAAGAAMTHRLSRGELYDLVWSQPMQRLAKQFGISDVALAKTCRRAEIPVPRRRYWAKSQAGKKVTRIALPPRGPGVSDDVFADGFRRTTLPHQKQMRPDGRRPKKTIRTGAFTSQHRAERISSIAEL